jgi:lysozyme
VIPEIVQQLKADEGVRPTAYRDHLGYLTIGVGRLIDSAKPGSGLRSSEIEMLLRNDVEDRIQALARALPWFFDMDEARQGVLVNMAFQMGTNGLLGFKNTLKLVEEGKYAEASARMLESAWAKQTPARAARLSQQMKTGKWVFQ